MLRHNEDGSGSDGVEFDLYAGGFGGVALTPRRPAYLLAGPIEETDEEGSPVYDPPQDPEPAPDGPSSPTSNGSLTCCRRPKGGGHSVPWTGYRGTTSAGDKFKSLSLAAISQCNCLDSKISLEPQQAIACLSVSTL